MNKQYFIYAAVAVAVLAVIYFALNGCKGCSQKEFKARLKTPDAPEPLKGQTDEREL